MTSCTILKLIFFLCLYIALCFVHGENLTDAENLYSAIFNNYNKELKPAYGQTIIVYIGMYLFSIIDFDEIAGTNTIMGGLIYSWYDPRLTWNATKYGGLSNIMVPSTTVWYPEIYFLNPADKMVPVGKKYFKARVYDMGGVSRIVGSIIKTTCDVDITYFPFDEQTCEIDFYTFGHSSNEIFFRISETDIDLTYFRKNAQWEVTESRLKPHDKVKFNGTITAVIGLKRYPEYFIVNILIPVLFLCLLNPVVFLLPPESGERISYTVTIFLSLAVFMTLINDNMPKSSRPMSRLSIFLVIMIGFSTALCILAIVNTKLYFRDKAIPVSTWMKKTMDILKFKWCSKLSRRCRSKVTHKNDTDKSGDSQEHKDVMEPYPEKTTWKKFATEIDIVAFCYTLFFLALTCTIFIITGLI